MNQTVTDTPRTDAKEKETARLGHYKHAYHGWQFARVLERELNKIKRDNATLIQAVNMWKKRPD